MSKRHSFLDKRLGRLDDTRLIVKGLTHPETTIFANKDVLVESSAVDELLQVLELDQTVERLKERKFLPDSAELLKVVVTPDVHKGAGIPIGTVLATRGFVVPAAVGNDIGCGMRLHTTNWKAEEVLSKLDELEKGFRHTYFEGGRNIPMTHNQREALFLHGLSGLANAVPPTQEGLWQKFHQHASEIPHVMAHGSLRANRTEGLNDFMNEAGLTRDGQVGSIGGGNHFVEIQRIEKVLDATTAYAWGLKVGQVAIMIHSGSVAIGHLCAEQYMTAVQNAYPRGLKHPSNKLYVIPRDNALTRLFFDSLHNAANFAFANRLFLALMALDVLERTLGPRDTSLVYDAPHNLIWNEVRPAGLFTEETFVHRKGACPARNTEFAGPGSYRYGEPVLVPGSMGSSSYVLAGLGNPEALWSASHGAGRRLSRGEALKGNNAEFEEFMRTYRVVTPVDFNRQDLRQRPDIIARKLDEIKTEAPYAYKDVGAVVETLSQAGIAKPVAELRPMMTIKG
jgi:tRNA-splicing ligase RtcB